MVIKIQEFSSEGKIVVDEVGSKAAALMEMTRRGLSCSTRVCLAGELL